MKIYAILLAAGIGLRMGISIPKQLVKIKGKEIILRSLEIFTRSSIDFEAVIITTPPPSVFEFNWGNFFKNNITDENIDKLHIITGGATRQDSVNHSIKYLESILPASEVKDTIVFIHDSARPFIKDKELSLLLDKTAAHGVAFLCSLATDTIKEIDLNKSISSEPLRLKTLRRDRLISAKTPQVFRFDIMKNALKVALETNFVSTDDISLVENLDMPVVPIISTDFNIKITSALDIEIAGLLCDKFK